MSLPTHNTTDIKTLRESLKQIEEICRGTETEWNHYCLLSRRAELDYALGQEIKAAEDLISGLDGFPKKETMPELLGYIDTASLLVEILLKIGRNDEALELADKIFGYGCVEFEGTYELIKSEELYARCLLAVGRIEEAKGHYEEAMGMIEEHIAEAVSIRDDIKEKL